MGVGSGVGETKRPESCRTAVALDGLEGEQGGEDEKFTMIGSGPSDAGRGDEERSEQVAAGVGRGGVGTIAMAVLIRCAITQPTIRSLSREPLADENEMRKR